MNGSNVLRSCLLSALSLTAPFSAGAQGASGEATRSAPITNVAYEVTADRARLAERRLQITTSFDVSGTAPVLLSLPSWTPGAYEISNFARSVSGFAAVQGSDSLRWDKTDPDTWRVRPSRAGRVTVTFNFTADTLDNGMAWSRPDFVMFNGTNVFVYPEGQPAEFASTVTVRTEPDFLIATGMPRGAAARTYRAANYHELVDMPFFVGQIDLDSAVVSGKTVRLATYPRGAISGAARATAWDQIKRSIPPQVLVFGDVPWDTYTVLELVDSSYGGMSGLEHANSHVNVVAPGGVGSDFQPSLFAHEIFHAWNVKRLRPAELVPYRYDRVQPTPWLWVSEGITDYYADLVLVRGGIVDTPAFYAATAEKIGEIGATVPFALEDASLSAWIGVQDGTASSYYPKGSLAGFLLDIMIRDASENRRSLDTVMRDVYESTYKRGRGFTHADWWGAVRRAANGRSFEEFERRYIDGRDPYPWAEQLKVIGLQLQPDSVARLGVSIGPDQSGGLRVMSVVEGGPAAAAGIKEGDILMNVGASTAMEALGSGRFRAEFAGKPAGTPVPVRAQRGAQTINVQIPLRYSAATPKIVEDPAATPRAVRLRNGLIRGTTDR
jgi:predicted metalloprotease with PDZ domain